MLSDEKQRGMYDQFGHAGVDPNSGFGGGPGGGPGGNPFDGFEGFNFQDGSFHFSSSGGGGQDIDPEELFDALFGGGRRKPRGPRRGADLQMNVSISFKEAVFGASKDLNLRYQVRDSSNGRVEVKERVVTVDIPPGVDNGMNLRLQGQGAEGDKGAARGNLFVHVAVQDDKYFHRDGIDVHTEVPISLAQAVLGGTVDVRTLTGEVEMKIPKGTQVDTKLLLRGKGIPHLNTSRKGNQVVHLKIEIPTSLSARQEELMRDFDEETRPCGNGISGKLAAVAETAFQKIFGTGKGNDDNNDNDNDDKKTSGTAEDDEQQRKAHGT